MVHLSVVDSCLVASYVAALLFIGVRASRRSRKGIADFILASRTLTLPMFVATLVSTWYGGILGVGEFSYRYGLSNWVVFGLPYYAFALVFALFLAPKVRATNLYTIPDKLEQSYGRPTAIVGGFLTFILITPAAYVLMLGILVQLMFGVNLTLAVVLTTFLATCYLWAGGFRSDVWTNAFEFILMFLGFIVMVVAACLKFGGFSFLESHLPSTHLTWNGGNSWQFILVWFFIALWTLVDPAFHQRCYAARDGATARNGILVSIGFWFFFDFMTTTTGLYARAAIPSLSQPMFSYPVLAELTLPVVAKGLFFVGMIATIMSSLSSLTLISAITVGKDIVGRLSRSPDREGTVDRWTKIGLILSGLFSIVLALAVPSVVSIWYTIGTCIVPGLLVPILAGYTKRFTIPAPFAMAAMLSGWALSTASFLYGRIHTVDGAPGYFLSVEPMYPGLCAALLIWCVALARRRR